MYSFSRLWKANGIRNISRNVWHLQQFRGKLRNCHIFRASTSQFSIHCLSPKHSFKELRLDHGTDEFVINLKVYCHGIRALWHNNFQQSVLIYPNKSVFNERISNPGCVHGFSNQSVRHFSCSGKCDSQNKRTVKNSVAKLKFSSVKDLKGFMWKNRLLNHTRQNISSHVKLLRNNILNKNEHFRNRLKVHRRHGLESVNRMQRKIASKVKRNKENIKTVPNLLTTLRMGSAPILAYLVVNEWFVPAFSIFVIAGLTDMLDGYIARNFKNQRTALGTALDPLADKLLMSFLTVSLTSAGLVPLPLTVLILGRDVGLIAGSFYIRYVSLAPPRTLSRYFDVSHVTAKLYPSTISKANTLIQLSYVALTLAAPVFDFVDHPGLQALMYTTAVTTFLSGADYVFTWRKRLKIIKND